MRRLVLGLVALFLAAKSLGSNETEIVMFSPEGSVKKIQQVTVNFSGDMIAMGDPRSKNDPFTIKCNGAATKDAQYGDGNDGEGEGAAVDGDSKSPKIPKYTTRWADNKNWVLDFEEPLPSGVRCVFKVKKTAKDLAGKKIKSSGEYRFTTAGPALLGVSPEYGNIEPDQYFVADVDGDIDLKSVESNAYFEVSGMPDKSGVKIITGTDRDTVIKAGLKDNWRWNGITESTALRRFIVLAAKRKFPENAQVVLHWPVGIRSKSGLSVEEAQKFTFTVIPDFSAKFSCERVSPDRGCSPLSSLFLSFSKRVPLKNLKGAKLVAANGKIWLPVEFKNGDQNKNVSGTIQAPTATVGVSVVSNFDDDAVDSLRFEGPFPEATKFKVVLPANIKDELGRPLTNQKMFPLEVATDDAPPLLKFSGPFGILELNADPILPVSVRNIETKIKVQQLSFEGKAFNLSKSENIGEIITLYRRVQAKNRAEWSPKHLPALHKSQGTKFELPKTLNKKELELVGIPLKKPGFHVVEMVSPILGKAYTEDKSPMYVTTAALVTNMAVHFKYGRESSLVWVTELSSGKPVADVQVTVVNPKGKKLASGVTSKDGTLALPQGEYPCDRSSSGLPQPAGQVDDSPFGGYFDPCEVFVFAQKGEDISFVSNEWSKGIETWRFNVRQEYLSSSFGPSQVHTILDRTLAHAGDVINMKHVIRDYRGSTFVHMDKSRRPKRVLIRHVATNKIYTLPFEIDEATGTALGKFSIPKDAALGDYAIFLSNKPDPPKKETEQESDPFDYDAAQAGAFMVMEYRLPLMKAAVKIQGQPLVRPSQIKADLSAGYLSGGPAKGLKVRIRSMLRGGYFEPDVPGGKDYNFFGEMVKPGVVEEGSNRSEEEPFLQVSDVTLNADGGALATVSDIPAVKKVSSFVMEMEYSDPNGEIKTASSQVPVFPADYIVGLRTDSWLAEPGKAKIQGVITDSFGKPQRHRPFTVEAFQSNYITHRKRLVGGFYSYDSKTTIVSLGKVCEGKSDELGRFECQPSNLPAGSITLQAQTTDEKNRATYASVQVSVFDKDSDSWWMPSDSDRIDLIPEKNKYSPGEKAKLVVRSPFKNSTVLVTLERAGVLESFVTEISRDKPTIEIPIKGSYAPNIFVSTVALRGRVGEPKPTALIDLGRPAIKMGLTALNVGWRDHELLVSVKADKSKYKAREKAQVTIQVKTATGEPLPAGSEVAIAAVDEALLRLQDNTSWDILTAMMEPRGLAVSTSSGQNEVIGRRHFGSKAKPPGGGGGAELGTNRELFEPMLLWEPKLKLSSSGEAKITVPLNDSMTSFRITAVAIGGTHFFGSGETSIESTKDLIVYPGFAPLVREGDQIKNSFTVRNTTAESMKAELKVWSKEISNLSPLPVVELGPSEAKTLDIPMVVPNGIKEFTLGVKAKDLKSGFEDSVTNKIRVHVAVPERVLQATLFQLEKPTDVPVKQPSDAIPDRGGIRVDARSTLVSGLAGVKSYMEDYGYTCLEQRISRGIVLEDKIGIEKIVEQLPSYVDSEGLLKFFPSSFCGSAQLSRYVLNILQANSFDIPAATRATVIEGLRRFVKDQNTCTTWWDRFVRNPYKDQEKLLVIEALSRFKAYDQELLQTINITPNLWQTETVVAWSELLRREANIPKRDTYAKQAENILRSRMNFQGSIMNLQGHGGWEAGWRLFSSPDQEALGVFGIAVSEDSWARDIGRMARGIIARLRLGRWDTTMANAWAVTQLRKFSAKFEKDKVTGETKLSTNGGSEQINWKAQPSGDKRTLKWPKGSDKKESPVSFSHSGAGKPWIHLETLSAVPLKGPFNMGYKISKKITPVTQEKPGSWQVGDVADVELTVNATSDQPWVVVRDPVPAGASHLGAGLKGSSEILNSVGLKKSGGNQTDYWPTEFEEKSHAYFTSYAGYLPRGTYKLNYRIRLNSAGQFKLPPSRVEAMYSPEAFGESPNDDWKVAK